MKKWKNGSNSAKTHHTAKFPITEPPKVWVSGPPCINRNGKFVSAIVKKWKNGSNSAKTHHTAKFPITDPPKVWVSGPPCVDRNGKLVSAIVKKWKNGSKIHAKFPITSPPKAIVKKKLGKMALTLQKLIIQQNFQLPSPPKSGSPVLPASTEMENLHQPL